MYFDNGVGFINTFVKMYGKACLKGQIVLHMDSNSVSLILKKKLVLQFPGLRFRNSTGGSNGKLTGVFAQDAQGPGPNPQHHS